MICSCFIFRAVWSSKSWCRCLSHHRRPYSGAALVAMAVQSGSHFSPPALVWMQHHRTSVDYHRRSLCVPVRITSAFFFSIAHFCSVYCLCLFVYLVISTVHLVVFIAYMLLVSVTDCSIHCVYYIQLFSCKCNY